jgi:acyl-CoA synthetase (AMP-forming)/AMP-acid ligase II
VGVTGVEDERAGERPVALVVLSPKGKEEAASNALLVQQAIMNHVEHSKVSAPCDDLPEH